MHHGPAGAIDPDAIAVRRAVASEHENHLQLRKGTHEGTVFYSEARQVLRRNEREIHAGLEHEPFFFRAIEEKALRMTDIIRDRSIVLADEDVRGMAREAFTEARYDSRETRA